MKGTASNINHSCQLYNESTTDIYNFITPPSTPEVIPGAVGPPIGI